MRRRLGFAQPILKIRKPYVELWIYVGAGSAFCVIGDLGPIHSKLVPKPDGPFEVLPTRIASAVLLFIRVAN